MLSKANRNSIRPPQYFSFGTLLLVLLSTAFFAGKASAQVSPGPLSRAHQSIAGPTMCTACHKLGAGSATFSMRLVCDICLTEELAGSRICVVDTDNGQARHA